jgi:hypothetical protein
VTLLGDAAHPMLPCLGLGLVQLNEHRSRDRSLYRVPPDLSHGASIKWACHTGPSVRFGRKLTVGIGALVASISYLLFVVGDLPGVLLAVPHHLILPRTPRNLAPPQGV